MRLRLIRSLSCSALLLLAAVPGLRAQSLRGHLTTPDGQQVPAALFTLLDEKGTAVRATVSGARGEFAFGRVAPGRYSLRVERIGQPTVTGQQFVVGPTTAVNLALRQEAHSVGLGEVQAGRVPCAAGGPRGVVAPVWEHAVRYLRIAALLEERGLVRVQGLRYVRALDPALGTGERVMAQTAFLDAAMPFPGDAPDLVGFAPLDSGRTSWYQVPSPAVLLAGGFLENHCVEEVLTQLALPGRVALRFRPLRRSGSPGLEGLLWLDRASAELLSVEFEYRAAAAAQDGRVEGVVGFTRGDDGLPRISRWRMREPRLVPGGGTELIESGALALDARGAPLDDADGVFASLYAMATIDSLMVAAERAELMPDAPWRWTQGTLDLLGPTDLVRFPQPYAFDAVLALRTTWLSRRGSTPFCKDLPQDLRGACAARQPLVYLENMPVDGDDVEDKLMQIPIAEVGAVEYLRPIEASMLLGALKLEGRPVILVHRRRW